MQDNNNHTIRIQSSANLSTVTIKQLLIISTLKYLGVDNLPSDDQTKQLKTLLVSVQRGNMDFFYSSALEEISQIKEMQLLFGSQNKKGVKQLLEI